MRGFSILTRKARRRTPWFFLVAFLWIYALGQKGEAAPLEKVPTVLYQPNGSRIDCYSSGDEYFNYLHDSAGALIVQDAGGWYTYAENQDGQPVSSGERVPSAGSVLQRSVRKDREKVRMTAAEVKPAQPEKAFQQGGTPFLSSASGEDKASQGTEGKKNRLTNLVLFIRFQDEEEFVSGPADAPVSQIPLEEQSLGGVSLDLSSSYRDVAAYFEKISGNTFTTDAVFLTADPSGERSVSYQDSHPRSYYQAYSASNLNGVTEEERFTREMTLLENALRATLPSLPKDVLLDQNGDGEIDNITFIVSGTTGGWNQLLWPHSWELGKDKITVKDGSDKEKLAKEYNLAFSSPRYAGTGVLAHELLHTVGMPDLYRYGSGETGAPVGAWDVMGSTNYTNPQYPGAYMMEKYAGWGRLEELPGSGEYTLHPLGTGGGVPSGYRIPTGNPNEYIVAEYRKNGDPQNMTDDNVPRNGLVLYRVDKVTVQGNRYGSKGSGGDEVYVFRPGDASYNAGTQGRLREAALNAGFGEDSFGSASAGAAASQCLYFRSGENTGIVVSQVRENEDGTLSFRVDLPEDQWAAEPDGVYDLAQSPYVVRKPGEYRFTGTSGENTITVAGGVSDVKLILDGASLDLSGSEYASPILLRENSQVEVAVEGQCALTGGAYAPAVCVSQNASLTLSGSGTLKAQGGGGAAAVGGGAFAPAGSISLRDVQVEAVGGGSYAVSGGAYLVQPDGDEPGKVYQLKGGPAPAIGAGEGQRCGDIQIEQARISASAQGGVAVGTGLEENLGGSISLRGGSLQADGAVYAGPSFLGLEAELGITLEENSKKAACLDAGESIRLENCQTRLETMTAGNALGNEARLPAVTVLGGSLEAASRSYTVCSSALALDGETELFLASAAKETLFSGIFSPNGDPAPVQPGAASDHSERACLLEGTLESPLPAGDRFRLEGEDGFTRLWKAPAGCQTLAFGIPGPGTFQISSRGGESTGKISVASGGVYRAASLSFSRDAWELQRLSLCEGPINITSSGEYVLYGGPCETTVTVGDGLEVVLRLDGVSFSGPQNSPALRAGAGASLSLVLEDGSNNQITGGDGSPAIWAEDALYIEGAGSLTAVGGGQLPGLSADSISLDTHCQVTALSAGSSAVVRRGQDAQAPWGLGESMPVLLAASFEKKLSDKTEVFIQSENGVISHQMPKGTLSFFQTLETPGTVTVLTEKNTSSGQLDCAEGMNLYASLPLTAWSRVSRPLNLSGGDLVIEENGVYSITGSTDRHTITVADGVTATLILDGVQMRVDNEQYVKDRQGLIQLGENVVVTLSLSGSDSIDLWNRTKDSECSVVSVPRTSRLTVEGDQVLTAMPGAEGALFGMPEGLEAGEIVLRGGDIRCSLPADHSSGVLVGGSFSKVELRGGSLQVSDSHFGCIGGANSQVAIYGGELLLEGGDPAGAIGGPHSRVDVEGGNISLSLGDGCIGIGGVSSVVDIRGGTTSVEGLPANPAGMQAGVGGPHALIRLTGGVLLADSVKGSGSLGGTEAKLEAGPKASILIRCKQKNASPLEKTLLAESQLSGGFLKVDLAAAFGSETKLRLVDINSREEAASVAVPGQYYGFFAYLPQGTYDILGPEDACAGTAAVHKGETSFLTKTGFGRLPGIWFEDVTVPYDGSEHRLELSGVLPAGASVTYQGEAGRMPGKYPFTATVTHPEGSYTLSATLTVAKAPLTVTGAVAKGKERYDGTCATSGTVLFSGQAAKEKPVLTADFRFKTPDVGTQKPVLVENVVLSPEWEDRYVLKVPSHVFDGVTAAVRDKAKAAVNIDAGSLAQAEGAVSALQVTTVPSGLSYTLAYNESAELPQEAGSYRVKVSVEDPNYSGTAWGILTIGKAFDVSLGDVRITAPGTYRIVGSTNANRIVIDCKEAPGAVTLCLEDVSIDLRDNGGIPLEVAGCPEGGLYVALPGGSETRLWAGEGCPAVSWGGAQTVFTGEGSLLAWGGRGAQAAEQDGEISLKGVPHVAFFSTEREMEGNYPAGSFGVFSFDSPASENREISLVSKNGKKSFLMAEGFQSAAVSLPWAGEEGASGFLYNAGGDALGSFSAQSGRVEGLVWEREEIPQQELDLTGLSSVELTENGVYRVKGLSAEMDQTIFLADGVCARLILDEAVCPEGGRLRIAGSSTSWAALECVGEVSLACPQEGFSDIGVLRLDGSGTLSLSVGEGILAFSGETELAGNIALTLGPQAVAFTENKVSLLPECMLTVTAEGQASTVFGQGVKLDGQGGRAELRLSGNGAVGFCGLDAALYQGTHISASVTGASAAAVELWESGPFLKGDASASFTAWAAGDGASCLLQRSTYREISASGPLLYSGDMGPRAGVSSLPGSIRAISGDFPNWQEEVVLPQREKDLSSFLMMLPGPGLYSFTWEDTFLTAETNACSQVARDNVEFQVFPEISGVLLEGLSCVYDGTEKSVAVKNVPAGAQVSCRNNTATEPGEYLATAQVTRPGFRTAFLSAKLVIAKRPLTVAVSVQDKETYDGTVSCTGTVRLGNAVNGDRPQAVADFAFDTPDVGENKPVSVTKIRLVEDENHWSSRYCLETTDCTAVASVKNKAQLTLSFQDGCLTQTYGSVSGVSVDAPQGMEAAISYDGGTELPSLPGTYEVTARVEDKNRWGFVSGQLTIEKKPLVLQGVRVPSVKEDADSLQVAVSDSEEFDGPASGVIPGDEVLISYLAVYPELSPGEKTAALSQVVLSGAQADRYFLTGSGSVEGTGFVEAAEISGGGEGGGNEGGGEEEGSGNEGGGNAGGGGSAGGASEEDPGGDVAPDYADIEGHWAKEDILSLTKLGLLVGYEDGRFYPENKMDRAMLVTVLCRMAGADPKEYSGSSYSDVAEESWYAPYVQWASQQGVALGMEDGNFHPEQEVTREEIAVFLYRFSGESLREDAPTLEGFSDSGTASSWAEEALRWALDRGIIKGRESSLLAPLGKATRAEVSAMVRRYLEL